LREHLLALLLDGPYGGAKKDGHFFFNHPEKEGYFVV